MIMAGSVGNQGYMLDAVKHSTIWGFCVNFEACFFGLGCHEAILRQIVWFLPPGKLPLGGSATLFEPYISAFLSPQPPTLIGQSF